MSSASHPLTPEEQNKHLVLRWFEEVWNQGRRETIFELFPANAVLHDGSRDMRGPKEFSVFYDQLRADFADFQVTPVISLSEGDLTCLHWTAEFLHKSTSRRMKVNGTSIVRVKNGQFVEAWQNWDAAHLATQLAE
jgi:predicted SnoaL-like aldol condensation-catalyzing enzyme